MRLVHHIGTTAFVAALFLTGCNGPSDASSEAAAGYNLSLNFKTVVNGACSESTDKLSFNSGDSICAIATLKNGSTPIAGQRIGFTTDFGAIDTSSRLSDANGAASIILSNPNNEQGAGTLTANFTQEIDGTIQTSRNFEFVGEVTPPQESVPTIIASIQKTGNAITRFKVGEIVQLQAKVVDPENNGLEGHVVSFKAGNSTLNPATALTLNSGVAQVSYTPTANELGAHSMTAIVEFEEGVYAGQTIQSSTLFEVIAADAIEDYGTIKLGHFNADNEFVEGALGSSLPKDANGIYQISAGGTFGVTATLINQDTNGNITLVQTPTSVSFSSDCVTANAATLDSPMTTLSGSASSTFQDVSCSGNSERNDQIVATTQVGNQTLSALLPFTLARQTLANLSFISATPQSIRIKGGGGTDASESSLVTFKVSSANGQGAAQQQVNFTLDTAVGGVSFANGSTTTSGITNAQGLVSVRVLSGTVPTPVRVVASATDSDTNEVITSQSEQLSINTGLPQQLGMGISASVINPEAIDGETSLITVYVTDSFGNPAPDDTTINFTTEGGQIQPNCLTQNGFCSVTWTSANPRVTDHRITVMAYALGHETFFDTNGNNIFDAADGTAITNACLDTSGNPLACSGNGMDIETYHPNGFSDLPDAFRDDNEDAIYDAGEKFFNLSGSQSYGGADGLFNGPQCEGALCGTGQANKSYIRKALVMTMSGSNAFFTLKQDGTEIYNSASGSFTGISPIAVGTGSHFEIQLYDSAGQIMPAGTTVFVSASSGELGFLNYTVPNANSAGGTKVDFTLNHDGIPATSAITITATTPNGTETRIPNFNVTLQ